LVNGSHHALEERSVEFGENTSYQRGRGCILGISPLASGSRSAGFLGVGRDDSLRRSRCWIGINARKSGLPAKTSKHGGTESGGQQGSTNVRFCSSAFPRCFPSFSSHCKRKIRVHQRASVAGILPLTYRVSNYSAQRSRYAAAAACGPVR